MKMLTTQNWFVVGMGVVTVFLGLICIIILCKLIGVFCKSANKAEVATVPSTTPAVSTVLPIENKQEIIAAVSAAVAEELGEDISAIRILSFKKL